MEHAFEDIEVKENAIELLDYALTHKRKKCMIGTGSMTDPYIPLEKELGTVRKALQLIDRHGFPLFYLSSTTRKRIFPAYWICADRPMSSVSFASAWG